MSIRCNRLKIKPNLVTTYFPEEKLLFQCFFPLSKDLNQQCVEVLGSLLVSWLEKPFRTSDLINSLGCPWIVHEIYSTFEIYTFREMSFLGIWPWKWYYEKTNTQPDCSNSQLLWGHEGSFFSFCKYRCLWLSVITWIWFLQININSKWCLANVDSFFFFTSVLIG